MKGFLHIVEILIVSMLVFLVILQFASVPKQNIDWESMRLSTQANDILFSLDRKGVDWLNSSQVRASLDPVLSNNTIYSLTVKNAMKSSIKVGCICSAAETANLRSNLSYFEINGHGVSFTVTQISTIAFSHDYDVIVVNNTGLAIYHDQIRQFLAADKGIVEFRTLHQSDVDSDSVQGDFFGLSFVDSSAPQTPAGFNSGDSSDAYYNIYKYFHNVPIYQENFTYGASGWTISPPTWTRSGGVYTGNDPAATSINSNISQGNYTFGVSFKAPVGYAKNVTLLSFWQSSQNHTFVNFDFNPAVAIKIGVWENVSGIQNLRGTNTTYPLSTSKSYDVRIAPLKDGRLEIYVNGTKVLTSNPVNVPASSQIGLGVDGGPVDFDNVRVTFPGNRVFSGSFSGQNMSVLDGNAQKIILSGSNGVPACIVNSNIVDNKGRTAWISGPSDFSQQDYSVMFKTLVIWAAGDENNVVSNDIKNIPVITSLYRTYDQDMYEPVEVVLTMGNTYR